MAKSEISGTGEVKTVEPISSGAAAPSFPTAEERATQLSKADKPRVGRGEFVGVPDGYVASAVPSGSAAHAARLIARGYLKHPTAKCVGSEEMEVWVLPKSVYDAQTAESITTMENHGLKVQQRTVNLAELFKNLGENDPRISAA